jgi:hypothetical protein
MANAKGESHAHALSPSQQSAGGKEQRLDALLERLGLKKKNEMHPEYHYHFDLAGPSQLHHAGDMPALSKPRLIAFALKLWPQWDFHVASAAFDVFDEDGSGRLNQHEFAVLLR